MNAADRRTEALRWAEHVRAVREAALAALTSGELSLEACFGGDHDPAVAAIYVGVALEAVPGVRKVDARRALSGAGLRGDVSLGGLDARDRARVLEIADRLNR